MAVAFGEEVSVCVALVFGAEVQDGVAFADVGAGADGLEVGDEHRQVLAGAVCYVGQVQRRARGGEGVADMIAGCSGAGEDADAPDKVSGGVGKFVVGQTALDAAQDSGGALGVDVFNVHIAVFRRAEGDGAGYQGDNLRAQDGDGVMDGGGAGVVGGVDICAVCEEDADIVFVGFYGGPVEGGAAFGVGLVYVGEFGLVYFGVEGDGV